LFHVVSDAIGSAGAIVASIVILLTGYYAADPAISVLVGLLILSSSWILIRDAVDILLEGTPAHVNIVSLQGELRGNFRCGIRSRSPRLDADFGRSCDELPCCNSQGRVEPQYCAG
jgi:Co/Zn/Cd efflux system component